MLRGTRPARKPRTNMVAIEWLPTGNPAPPSCALPTFYHQVPQRIDTCADAVVPGLALGDTSWTVVQTQAYKRSIPFHGTHAVRGRPLTSYPTIPYHDETVNVQPHGLGLSRKSMTRPSQEE